MFGLVVRLLLVLAVLLGLLLALPRTLPATLAWFYPEAAYWHDARDREVLLAIDDGPDPATTPQILDALDAAEAKAMFFVLGEKAVAHPELILEIAARGHKVGVHMFRDEITALRSPEDIATDLTHTVNAIPESVPLTWLRPATAAQPRAPASRRGRRSARRGRGYRAAGCLGAAAGLLSALPRARHPARRAADLS